MIVENQASSATPDGKLLPLSFLVPAYNEESRIGNVLSHAIQWASEVIVVDKSSSDRTAAIAAEFGSRVRILTVPYSPQGQAHVKEWVCHATYDWIYVGTCSEIPTRKLIEAVSEVLSCRGDTCDVVMVPRRLYSLGIHHPCSPWSVPYYPFLFHRRRAVITDRIHEHITASDPNRVYSISYSEDCCVHHFTHSSARRFVEVHAEYAEIEADLPRDSDLAIWQCFRRFRNALPGIFRTGADWPGILAAWGIYNLTNVLFIWEKRRGLDVSALYGSLTHKLLREEWGLTSEGCAAGGEMISPTGQRLGAPPDECQTEMEKAVFVAYCTARLLYALRRPATIPAALARLRRSMLARLYRRSAHRGAKPRGSD